MRERVALLILVLSGCTKGVRDDRPAHHDGPPVAGPGGVPATAAAVEEDPGRDFWYRRFHPYMDAAFRRDYLATPRPERYARFQRELVSFQERERLLEEARPPLAEEERAAYYRLDSAEACRAWIEARGDRREEERLP